MDDWFCLCLCSHAGLWRSATEKSRCAQIADDVNGISWFFNKHPLKVRCLSVGSYEEAQADPDRHIPDDWHISVKTLEDDINSEVERMEGEFPNDHYQYKRPIL